jgi:cation transport protein ChaC
MWVFGYGSLMWDGWEREWGCIRSTLADLDGFSRIFNKASVRNWGTKSLPCPTLNLVKTDKGCCRGLAFQFSNSRAQSLLKYLTEREGKDFVFHEMTVRLHEGDSVPTLVSIYKGKNIIKFDSESDLDELILKASGRDGLCITYVKSIADQLESLGIKDPIVTALWKRLSRKDGK